MALAPPTRVTQAYTYKPIHFSLSRRTWIASTIIASLAALIPRLPRPPFWLIVLTAPIWLIGVLLIVVFGNVALNWGWEWYEGVDKQAERLLRRRERRRKAVRGQYSFRDTLKEQSTVEGPTSNLTEMIRARKISDKLASPLLALLDLIISTFINPWYTRISPSSTFPTQIQHLLLDVIVTFSTRLSTVEDLPQVLVQRIVPRLTRHFTEYRKIEHLLESATTTTTTTTTGVTRTSATVPGGGKGKSTQASPSHVHPALSSGLDPAAILQSHFPSLHHSLPPSSLSNPSPTIHAHLRLISDRILLILLPTSSRSDALLRTFVRELLVGKVLGALVETLSDPDTLNKLVEEQADRYQVRREEVSQLRAALENASTVGGGGDGGEGRNPRTPRGKKVSSSSTVPVEGGTIKKSSTSGQSVAKTLDQRFEPSPTRPSASSSSAAAAAATSNPQTTISEETSNKDFDKFLRSIAKLRGINDAKRLRTDVERAQRKMEKEVEVLDKVGNGGGKDGEWEKRRRLKVGHMERLELARKKADRKVKSLMGDVAEDAIETRSIDLNDELPLRLILQDPAANSFFMEFMDRRRRSRLVQFWIAVETFKNPLEVIGSSEDEDEDELTLGGHASQLWDASAIGTAEEDLGRIWQEYLDPGTATNALDVEGRFMAGIRKAVDLPEGATLQQRRRALLTARASSARAQRQIYEKMEDDDYPLFRKTELYRQSAATISADLRRYSSPMGARGPPAATDMLSSISETGSGVKSGPSLFVRPGPPSMQVPRWLSFSGKSNTTVAKPDASDAKSAGKPGPSSSPHLLTPMDLEAREKQAVQDLEDKRYAMRRLRSWSVSRSPSASALPMTPGDPKAASTEFLFGSPDEPGGETRPRVRGALFDEEPVLGVRRTPELKVERHAPHEADHDEFIQIERMEAIQAALTSIIEKEDSKPDWLVAQPRRASDRFPDTGSRASTSSQQGDEDAEATWPEAMNGSAISETGSRSAVTPFARPSMTSATLSTDLVTAVGHSHRMAPSSSEGADMSKVRYDMGDVQLAKPGDLELTAEIARMGDRIDKLRDQEATLETMIRTAELTGKQNELALLQRSQKDLQREIRTLGFRRAQYERQEFDNRLVYSQTRITVPTIMDETTEDGRIIRYVIEVQQFSADGDFRHGWTVARRYNDFYELNQELRSTPGLGDELRTRSIEIPGKQLVPIFTPAFLEHRRIALERYLKLLIGLRAGCDSSAVRAFLSRQSLALGSRPSASRSKSNPNRTTSTPAGIVQGNPVKSLYRSVAASLDDILSGPSMLDVMTEKMTRQTAGASEVWDASLVQLGNYSLDMGSAYLGPSFAPLVVGSPEVPKLTRAETADPFLQIQPAPQPQSTFTGPICDLMVELIGFKDNSWMRKQALILVVQQLLGSTIERKFRDGVRQAMHENAAVQYLTGFRDLLWPGGKPRGPTPDRTGEEKLRTKANAARKLQAAVPDIVASMIGKSNANRATRRIFSVYQIKILNQHLILTLLDEASFHPVLDLTESPSETDIVRDHFFQVLLAIFPEIGPLDGKAAHGHYA